MLKRLPILILLIWWPIAGLNCAHADPDDPSLIPEDPFAEWLEFENKNNLEHFVRAGHETVVEYTTLPSYLVVVDAAPDTPDYILAMIYDKRGNVVMPKHPLNTHYSIAPWSYLPKRGAWQGNFTASRSIFVKAQDHQHRFSIKLPTNHVVPWGLPEAEKVNLKESLIISRRRSDLIEQVDKKIGTKANFSVMREVVSVRLRLQNNGYEIRSLDFMKPNHRYIPALSLPYVGRQIAQRLAMDYKAFLEKYYAQALGKAKAQLLLRYGLQMETPNAQNMVIETDMNYRSTDRIIFRDIGDSRFVDGVAQRVSPEVASAYKQELKSGFVYDDALNPGWSNSTIYFEAGGIDKQLIKDLGRSHDLSYVQEVLNELDLGHHLDSIKNLDWDHGDGRYGGGRSPMIQALETILLREEGQLALQSYQFKKGSFYSCWAKYLKSGL